MSTRRFSLIGPGRAGQSLGVALVSCGWTSGPVFGRRNDPTRALNDVDLCVLAVPDDAIAAVASSIEPNDDTVLMHLSGATPLSALGDHRAASLHPLVSLAEPIRGAEALRSAWFAVAGDPMADRVAEELSGQRFRIADEDRALYHATAVVASNHLVVLLAQVERLAMEVGVPMEAFLPLIRGAIDNVDHLGAHAALTGPAARGDSDTIDQHRAAIAERIPDDLDLYNELVRHAQHLAGTEAAD
ncbi:MAG: DUF2520 domain-containing protein [Acidimicrobiales bacterium]|nr:DUF2520 domain-containing protein [Acidimicrobiales bacterium]RZV41137.1 MAG: DUF2520 domain-containing protein [Acidimicrobiales bacterium]